MRPSVKSLLMLPLAAALVVGCSDSNDSPADETSAPAPNGGTPPTVLTKFDGSYTEACTASDPNDASQGSEVITTTIAGDSGTLRLFSYSDADCAVPDTPAELVSEISISYPGGTVDTDLGTADFINVTPESVTVDGQPPTAEQMTQLNALGIFDTIYDIALLDGSSLYSGDTSGDMDGTTADNRPTTLDPVPAIRQ